MEYVEDNMHDYLFILLLMVSLIGYPSLFWMSAELTGRRPDKAWLKMNKLWFYIPQIIAFIIALFLMVFNEKLRPIVGFMLLALATNYLFVVLVSGFATEPEERSPRVRKLIRKISWLFSLSFVLFLAWAIICWYNGSLNYNG